MKLAKFLIYFTILLIVAIPCFSQNTSGTEEANPIAALRQERERRLAFGLTNEVSALIRDFINDRDLSFNTQLLTLFDTTRSDQIMRDIIELYTVTKSNNLTNQIINKIQERDYENRSVIVAGIRYIAEINAVEANEKLFLELLEDTQREYKIEAIKALTSTGNKKYSQPLMELYNTDDETPVKLQVVLDIGKLEDPETADFLREIIADTFVERTFRQYAINSLGYLKDEESFNDLLKAYGEEDPFIRMYALTAIAKYDRKEANDIIFDALKDENWRIRRYAVSSAGSKKSRDFIQILIFRAERDPDEELRIMALDALAEIGGKEAFDFIRSRALDPRANPRMRQHAFSLAVNKDTSNSLQMIEAVFEQEARATNQVLLERLSGELCRVEYSGLAPFFERMLESSSVIIRIAGLRGIRLNKISRLKDRVQAIADDQRQATSVRNTAIAALEVL